jgi:general secretion pathway protein J
VKRRDGCDQRGFTLIEVLIALAITAMVATLALSSLTAVMNSVESVRSSRAELTELNRFWMLISRDLRQYIHRPVRDEYGQVEPGMWGGGQGEAALNLTRIGWHNPNYHPRSNLQRVRYLVEEETLWRESYTVLDRTGESEPQRVPLLEGVLEFQLAFLPEGLEIDPREVDTDDWDDSWATGSDQENAIPPRALEVRLELEGWGEIRRLYEVPSL